MIERASEFGASAAVPLVGGDSTNMTAGDMLREAREAHGLHIDMVAAALKVTPQKLAALEADDIESLPDAVFARALAASVCRALRIDPAPVLAKLPGAQRPGLADADRTISRSLKSAAPRSGAGASGLPSRALLTVVVLLLLGAAVLFWLPQSAFDHVGAAFSRLSSSSEEAAPPSTLAAGTPAAAGMAVEPSAAPNALPVLPPPAAPAEPVAAAPAAEAAVGNDLIVFVARDESWITVTEAGGKQLIRRTVKAGETVGLTGALPLSVVVGRAAAVDVRVRGQAFDLTPLARSGGVARFEVKP
ncbi:helix-turn-helix domain-containing protein [Variovorax saccharolyticus]|uniref:helix-turn-helix domain-containing protein n=1 Tax=Variovorax saccharolyticus TaxID=3053516 RepID=UPI002576C88E|nr:helix-turn-helix domain-containing protein [Variovorax sp. J22R187]MDM0020377.1 helix-turn-helix domain-containing protein [Variovorax sp. J22R187]